MTQENDPFSPETKPVSQELFVWEMCHSPGLSFSTSVNFSRSQGKKTVAGLKDYLKP